MPVPDPVLPKKNKKGDEEHPSWALIGASRVSSNPPATLFDSDIQHAHYVVVRLSRTVRYRDLHRDRHHATKEIVEIALSEAQWASFVSTANVGQGVPCTIRRLDMKQVPGEPHEPRLRETMDEVENAAQETFGKIAEAFAAYEEKKTTANLRSLKAAIANTPANLRFTAESLSEHAENVVQRARADIEAMVEHKASQLGIEPGDITDTRLLGDGKEK